MSNLTPIRREFFSRDTIIVAKDLLGKYLVRKITNNLLIGKIIEIEAYLGTKDKASHSYNLRKTNRTKIMYEKPGTLYVYLIYGMYHCLNVITEPEGIPCAILIRKLFPVKGIELMKERRKVKLGKDFKNLMDGPGKLCMAMDITKENSNGMDSCATDSKLFFSIGDSVDKENIKTGTRIGIDYAEEDKDRLLRFWI
ncbi:MAG: DNA-3-methyladenine glycosylase [Promethearchaeota archaeon]|nr:MAG: DNA-3-methyladenine glycosylase [Candidatus Lokiarchaeota archaeon]